MWDHIDSSTGVIWICQSLKHRNGKLTQGGTKTRRSRRKIKALQIALDALTAHNQRQAQERAAAGDHWTGTGYVFTTETGTPIDPANLRRAFRALIAAAGIPAKQPTEDCPTRTTESVYIHQQEIIDMNKAAFGAYGNQFGNQETQKEGTNDDSEAA